ncbi:MAG: Inner membrane ABC transporter permease protein YcjP [Firmicutes bacterium ADurb.Bin506]|jgi:multiple sugar transport system permease protein|nr:MAG: Inner membrane ABC transporter permease protein YcjP [Firmicutes bacterium ADurb.Bin506]
MAGEQARNAAAATAAVTATTPVAAATARARRRRGRIVQQVLVYLAVALVVFCVLAPYGWMVSGSFKEILELQASDVTVPEQVPTWIPRNPTLRNYRDVNRVVPMFRYFKHSIVISVGSMIVSSLLSLMAAYALSRFRFRGREVYTVSVLATQMLPGILFLIPYYLVFTTISRSTGLPLRDTYWGMIFTYTSFALPFSIVMLRSYLNGIPLEIDEQAMIDGCTRGGALWRVVVPLATPGIVAVAIYSFIMAWNEVLFASVLTGRATRTVAVGIMDFVTTSRANWGGMMAACVVISIPVLVLFTAMQRYIVEGLIAGATKG